MIIEPLNKFKLSEPVITAGHIEGVKKSDVLPGLIILCNTIRAHKNCFSD